MSQKLLNRLMIIDGSYMMHRNLKIPELWDLKNKDNVRTGGIFGFLRSLGYVLRSDYYPILCWDAGLAQRRLEVYPNYKHQLDKQKDYKLNDIATKIVNNPQMSTPDDISDDDLIILRDKIKQLIQNNKEFGTTQDPDDYLYQYRLQRSYVMSICNSLGIPSIKMDGWEGDDLITIISRQCERSIIITDDRDMIQLLSPTTDVNRVMTKQYLTYDKYLQDNQMKSIREMIIIKAIEGDGSDNIPSVTNDLEERKYKVGGTTAAKLAKIIIDCNEDPDKYIPIIESTEGRDHNKYLGFVKCHDNYLRNMKLVDLSLVDNDPAVIDNVISELNSKVGKSNLMDVLSKLGSFDIINIDVNSMISKVALSSQYALK